MKAPARYRAGAAARWLGALVAWLVRALGASWRLRVSGEDPFAAGTPFVAAVWHRGLLVAAYAWRDRDVAVPVSLSRDGERVDRVLQGLGFGASPRGSSSRGATGLLREMVRRVRRGQVVGILPDGPRGPAGAAKPGVLALAGMTGVPLVPIGVAAAPARRLGSWDRALVPLPFARVHCRYGAPLRVPKRPTAAELEALRGQLEAVLHQLDREAERALEPGAAAALPAAPADR